MVILEQTLSSLGSAKCIITGALLSYSFVYQTKNYVYGRHFISRPKQRVALFYFYFLQLLCKKKLGLGVGFVTYEFP